MSLPSVIRCLALPVILATLQPRVMAQYGFESTAPHLGVYFGTFENGQGRWGMLVSWLLGEGHFDFIGRIPGNGGVVRSYPYAAEVLGGAFVGATPYIRGRINDDGSVTGDVSYEWPPNSMVEEGHAF